MKRIYCIILSLMMMSFLSFQVKGLEEGFTEEEEAYIESHSEIKIGVDPEFAPYEFIDSDGHYKGIVADYLKLIEVKTGLSFEVVEGLEWPQAYDMFLQGELDLLPCVGITQKRLELFEFSQVYLTYQRALLSREEGPIYSMDDLVEIKVGVQRNSSNSSYLEAMPGVKPIYYTTNKDLLMALSIGEIDSVIANMAASSYEIKEMGLVNIRVDQILNDEVKEFGMAINSDNSVLVGIINKGLSQITEEEKVEIRNKWLGKQSLDYGPLIKYMILGGVAALFLLGVFLYWNYILQKEIGNRKKTEIELLAAKEEALNANEAKSKFLAHMSHEIRTPLNAITGQTYLLDNTTTTALQEKYITGIKNASYNLMSTINDILDFSKIEAGEVQVESISFDLDRLLDKVSNLLMPKATAKNISFHVKKDMKLPLELIGDPTRIEQILINFVNNAIKFTESGDVSIDVVMLNEFDGLCNVAFSVIDTGMGISKEQLDHLFIPFHQLDSSISRQFGGTGLGLTISKELAGKMGGRIHVQSKVGEGSKFVLELPLSYNRAQRFLDESKIHPDFRGKKVLLIDDNKRSRDIVSEYLLSYQLEVIEASTLKDAHRLIGANHKFYDLIMVELNLPEGSVIEFIEQQASSESKIILMARSIQEIEYEMIEKQGVKHIIMKPVIASILFDSVMQVFGREILEQNIQHDIIVEEIQKHHHLLLVEDNEVNQMIEVEILSQKGYEVSVANNGLEAVEMMRVKDHPYELILMDIHMPIMDGYEATREIRKLDGTIPILAMTAVTFSDVRDETEAAGMDGYVMKPVEPETLFIEIEKYIHRFKKKNEIREIASESLENRIERCNHHDYLDIKQGLNRIGKNEKLYYEVLLKFYDDMVGTKEQVIDKIKNQELAEAAKIVHRLKGTSGNVGATRLFQSSKILMEAIKGGIEVDIGPYLWEFEKDITETENIIACMVEEIRKDSVESTAISSIQELTKEAEDKVRRLKNLLIASDLDAFTAWKDIDDGLKNVNPMWDKIKVAMDKYDFKSAVQAIEEQGL